MVMKKHFENANSGLRCLAKHLRLGTLAKRRESVVGGVV
jgi:hypothetical protein